MKKHKALIIILSLIALIAVFLLLPSTRSFLVMKVYSGMENSESVMHDNNFKIDIPSSKGWFPFVITFNTGNFGNWSKTGADMSIMYNFAKFDKSMSSQIFDADSKKHSSFYGAYVLTQDEGYFGYSDNEIDLDQIILTFIYDYKFLVLQDLGCKYPTFEVTEAQIIDDVNYLDTNGWTRIDAVMETNAMLHNYNKNHTSYIQYGKPKQIFSEDFPVIKMYGRLYIKAFDKYNSTIIVYVMSPSMETINDCDNNILQYIQIESTN